MAEALPTSHDKHDRPTKKRALSPTSKQAASVDALFANPTAALKNPTTSRSNGPAPPPEIVANVQGSSAGAGSGEFHVYKASRRREYERLRVMEEETAKEEGDAVYETKREEERRKDEEKTGKNRAKREKARARKAKKGGAIGVENGEKGKGGGVAAAKVKLKANGVVGGELVKARDEGQAEAMAVDEPGIVIHDDDD